MTITVSEETLKRVLAEFKLELMQDLQKYAPLASMAVLEARVADNQRQIGTLKETLAGVTAVSMFQRILWPALAFSAIGALGVLVSLVLHGG